MNEFVEKLLGRLDDEIDLNPIYDYEKGHSRAICEAIEIINELTEEYNNGWIPCSERLPNEEEMIKAYCRNKYGCEFIVMIEGANKPTTLYRTWDGFWADDNGNSYKVLAWQQLPEPYGLKEGDTE